MTKNSRYLQFLSVNFSYELLCLNFNRQKFKNFISLGFFLIFFTFKQFETFLFIFINNNYYAFFYFYLLRSIFELNYIQQNFLIFFYYYLQSVIYIIIFIFYFYYLFILFVFVLISVFFCSLFFYDVTVYVTV